MKKICHIFAILALLFVSGCEKDEKLKALQEADQLRVKDVKLQTRHFVTSPEKIAEVNRAILGETSEWKSMWYTHPVMWYSIEYSKGDEVIGYVFIGNEYFSTGDYIRSATSEEIEAVAQLLGVRTNSSSE